MERKRITCPESAHLEEIDIERTRLGLVIVGCSKFEPRCEVACARECARRLDQRDRGDEQDRVLIVFSRSAWTRPITNPLAQRLTHDDFQVELADTNSHEMPPP